MKEKLLSKEEKKNPLSAWVKSEKVYRIEGGGKKRASFFGGDQEALSR